MNSLCKNLFVALLFQQLSVSFPFQPALFGLPKSRECFYLMKSATLEIFNDTIIDQHAEMTIADDQRVYLSENYEKSAVMMLENQELPTPPKVSGRRESAAPGTSTSLMSQGGFQDLDGRHDSIIESIIEHYKGAERTSSGGNGDNSNGLSGEISRFSREENYFRRANVQLPPGWGKTLLALETLSRLAREGVGPDLSKVQTAIYVTPKLILVDQVLDFLDGSGLAADISHSRLIVASQTSRSEACTTSVDEIKAFLSSHESELRVIACTYNSLPRVGEALQAIGGSISFGIFDEAHEMEGAGRLFGYGLYDSFLPVDYRLFLTATPRRYTQSPKQITVLGSKLDKYGAQTLLPKREAETTRCLSGIRSFVDKALFGPCIERRTLRESVEQNITVPITLCVVDQDEVSEHAHIDSSQLSKDTLLPFAIEAAFYKLNVSRAVSFHSTNARARAFVDSTETALKDDISTFVVCGSPKMSAVNREHVLQEERFASKSIVANCKVLATGVDEADWELVVMADPVRSSVLARQMIGRVSRKAFGKNRGYVLVPVPIASDEELTEDTNGYETFTTAFEAMVGLDPELRQDVLFVIEESDRLGRPLKEDEYPPRVLDSFMLPDSMSFEMKNDIMNRAIREYKDKSSWNRMYDLLLVYRDREGNCEVPYSHKEEGMNLGHWLSKQRQAKKNGMLDISRQQALKKAGVEWNVNDFKWNRAYSLLLVYLEREGNCNVPNRYVEDGFALGCWLGNQRLKYKLGKLDIVKEEKLEEAGVEWGVFENQWETMFSLLEQFNEREGHCRVLQGHKEDGENLGRWLGTQTRDKRKGKLNASRQERLEKAGVEWDVRAERWETMFSLLGRFVAREGHCRVLRGHKEDGMNLGVWLSDQKQAWKAGKLKNSRKSRLLDLGVVFARE